MRKANWPKFLFLLTIAGCGIFNSENKSHGNGNVVKLPVTPLSPDTSFKILGMRRWYIIKNELDSSYGRMEIRINTPNTTKNVHAFFDNEFIKSCTVDNSSCSFSLTAETLAAGEHTLLLSADKSDTGFTAIKFNVSHPLFAVISCDWDHPVILRDYILRQDTLHINHPHLRITHFAGPYMFTDPKAAASAVIWQTNWLKNARSYWRDEIGLHIHPYCHFVRAAGLQCIVNPPFDNSASDSSGYMIGCYHYSEEEFSILLKYADSLFISNGLGKPTSFRAGGWTAGISTLRALSSANYVVDASGLNVSRAEGLKGRMQPLYNWLSTNWGHISDTSQPYYPNRENIATSGKPQISCLEVPDNGVLADYVTEGEMMSVFRAIWPGGALKRPKQLSIGYHPDSFHKKHFKRIDMALDSIDMHLAKSDAGPVIYATMSELPKIWRRN